MDTQHSIISQSIFILSVLGFFRRVMNDGISKSKNTVNGNSQSMIMNTDGLLQVAIIAHALNLLRKGKYLSLFVIMSIFPRFSLKKGYDEATLAGHIFNFLTFHRVGDLKLPPMVPLPTLLKFLRETNPFLYVWQEHLLEERVEKEFGSIAMTFFPMNRRYWSKIATQFVFVSDPDMVQEIMSNKDIFSTRGDTGFTEVLGEGLLGLPSGEVHTFHRRLISKFLSDNYLKSFGTVIEEEVEKFFKLWDKKVNTKERTNAYYDLSMLTLDVIMRIAFGVDESELMQGSEEEDNELAKGLDYGLRVIIVRTAFPWLKKIPFTNQQRKLDKAIGDLRALSKKVFDKGVKKLQEDPESAIRSPTMLSALISAKNDDGTPALTHSEILDELTTLRGAGHETSGNTMCWTLYLLHKNPEKLQKLREEVDRVLGDRKIATYEDSKKLIYTHAVVYETLRLFPTVPRFPREAACDTKVGGYDILKGAYIFVSQTGMNRSSKYWKEPEKFMPERFAENLPELQMTKPVGIPNGPLFGYLPFGSGNRTCIGQRLAMLEQIMILSSLVKSYDWTLDMKESDVIEIGDVTLGPKQGLFLKVSPRQ